MVRHRRPVRGGKQRFERNKQHRPAKPKPKRGKFDLRTATYVKERQLKNEEIENRRKRLEEENKRKRRYEKEESSDEEVVETNPLDELLSTFKDNSVKITAIESEEESESEDEASEDKDSEELDEEDSLNEDGEDSEYEDKEEDHFESEDGREKDEEDTNKNIDKKKVGRKVERKKNKNVKESEEEEEEEEEEEMNIEIEDEIEEDAETAKEDAGQLKDPFSIHLRNDLSDDMYDVISNVPINYESKKLNWPALGNVICMLPKFEEEDKQDVKKRKVSLLENKQYTKPREVPKPIQKVNWEKLYIKSQIIGNLSRANFANIKETVTTTASPMTSFQKELFSIINNYQDLLFIERTFSNADEIKFVYCMHVVNHILKTRTKILHHNAKLQKMKKGAHLVPDEYRDQGLVRPKVLILVPFKHSCLQIVNYLISILIGEDKGGSVVNKKRFLEDYSGNELALPKRKPKPEDYEETFKGNVDDTFKIGISVTKKALKLYTNFYSSDIIIASPLGLRMLIGAEGETDTDYDFLTSIELLILDQTDLFVMQNWDHLVHVLDHLHLQPKNAHDTDFSRIRSWCVNGWTKYYRQTLIFSGLQVPEIHGIFNKHCKNYAGKVKVVNEVAPGSVSQTIIQVPLVFQRMEATSPAQLMDARLQFFANKVLPHYKDSIMYHTLIYVPSYYDYVALRNYMNDEELSFVQICEYTKDAKVARARDMFFHSDAHFLVYSERAHFFHRRQIKGIRHLIFYAPPLVPHFFSEMCNLMQERNQNPKAGSESNMTVTVIYSKYDFLQLAAIVGTNRANRMMEAEKDVHMIMIKE